MMMFHEENFTFQKIVKRIELIRPYLYRQHIELKPFRFQEVSEPLTHEEFENPDNTGSQLLTKHKCWGTWNQTFVMHGEFQVPADWDSRFPAALYLSLGHIKNFSHPEALIYIDGKSVMSCDRNHQEMLIPEQYCDGKPHQLQLHGYTGVEWIPSGMQREPLIMGRCELVQIDPHVRNFLATARAALGSAENLPTEDFTRNRLLTALHEAFLILDTTEPIGETFYNSVKQAHTHLKEAIAQAGSTLPCSLVGIGHAHIDMAWLWTVEQTRLKAGRTFHNILYHMEHYDHFRFTQSQPQLYEFVRRDYPELFESIKQKVSEGKWEPIGGMWVEADCNLTGAEALVRQFTLGRSFFKQHFGPDAESPILWLPDTFGFPHTLPQLMKLADIEYFFTTKISWNNYNQFPYDSFWWQGLDGTRVLAHMGTSPAANHEFRVNYNCQANPHELKQTWQRYRHKQVHDEVLITYGYGDGGGGPTYEMLENFQEYCGFPGMPKTRCGTAKEYFKYLASHAQKLPDWNDELYLEYHRGTYTSQARNKRANRKCEILLHDTEFMASLAKFLDPSYFYPHSELIEAWKLLCLNQFHDILPGSSIGQVYTDALCDYERIQEIATTIQQAVFEHFCRSFIGDLLLINCTSFCADSLVLWEGQLNEQQSLQLSDGGVLETQKCREGVLIHAGSLEPYSVTPIRTVSKKQADNSNTFTVTDRLLENDYLRVEFSKAGDITQIYDKRLCRDVLVQGGIGNELQAFEDRPLRFDAWDIDAFFEDRKITAKPAEEIVVEETGPLRGKIKIKRKLLNSRIVQEISLEKNSACLRFDTTVDWREKHILLKAAFPVDLLAGKATYDIQWGNIERPTHRNTSWDRGKFEVCAHKWADLSESDYGVSLMNDCKYGHDIHGNVMRLTLLRSPDEPDPNADQGMHSFSYALLPHKGSWQDETIKKAYLFNDPVIALKSDPGQKIASHREIKSLVKTNAENIIIETVKWSEDNTGLIVRLYESCRKRTDMMLETAYPIKHAAEVNLLEAKIGSLKVDGNCLNRLVKPYEIVTLKLSF